MLHIYRIVRGLLTLSFAIIVIPVGGEFFIGLARKRGLYENPSEAASRAMNLLISIADLPLLKPLALVLFGLVIGLWIDSLVRKRSLQVYIAPIKQAKAAPGRPADPLSFEEQQFRISLRSFSNSTLMYCKIRITYSLNC